MKNEFPTGTFGYDLAYLQQKDNNLIVLKNEEETAQIIVSGKYQSKVFTSTAEGLSGKSLGFLNYKALENKEINDHINLPVGENRFWLGPEGGQYSIFFEKGKEQVFDNWHTPQAFDLEEWETISVSDQQASFRKEMELQNYMGTKLKIELQRKIILLTTQDIFDKFGIPTTDVKTVGYRTENTVINRNDFEWTPQTGTICVWMLDMFPPGENAWTLVPYYEGSEDEVGRVVTADYFGDIPSDRLYIKDGIVYLKTDGNFRSKIGMNPKRTTSVAGNYDPDRQRLTIIMYEVDKDATYMNQEWNVSKNPLEGDAMNAYNDGYLEDGSIMGPFLEVESASPGAFLKPAMSLTHSHQVFHFIGEQKELTVIAKKVLGADL